MKRITLSSIVSLLLLTACSNKELDTVNYNKYHVSIEKEGTSKDVNESAFFYEQEEKTKEIYVESEEVPKFVEPGRLPEKMGATATPSFEDDKKKVKVSVEDIPLNKFIHLVFGEILEVNYSVSEKVEKTNDKVTMRMAEKVTRSKLYSVVEGILANYNIQIQKKNGVYFIDTQGQKSNLKLDYKISIGNTIQYEGLPENEMIYQILPINYLSLSQAQDILAEFSRSKDGRVYTMDNLHALLIMDYVSSLKKGMDLLSIMDKPYMKDKTFKLVYLEHIDAKLFLERVGTIFQSLGITISNSVKGEPLSIIPIEEINALFVMTDKEEMLETLMYWKRKLDNLDKLGDKKQLFVYKTKNREAKEVQKVLVKILENSKEPLIVSNEETKTLKKEEKKIQNQEQVKVTVDEERNTLIFYMYPSEYKEVYELLGKIDTKASQILIEVTIAEVTLIDKLQYGVEWYLKNTAQGKYNWNLQTLENLGVGAGGISGAVAKTTGGFQALMNAFAQDNILKILSSPKLVVMNNKNATFQVGTQVPVITSQATSADLGSNSEGTPTLLQSVKYTSTGVNTTIKPTITSDNTITLSITQSVSEAQNNNTSSISSPIIVNRSITTEVVLNDSQELIIGGIIRENKSDTESKIPLLGDIPILGNLFKTYSETLDKTELIFIVKPHILQNTDSNKMFLNKFERIVADKY